MLIDFEKAQYTPDLVGRQRPEALIQYAGQISYDAPFHSERPHLFRDDLECLFLSILLFTLTHEFIVDESVKGEPIMRRTSKDIAWVQAWMTANTLSDYAACNKKVSLGKQLFKGRKCYIAKLETREWKVAPNAGFEVFHTLSRALLVMFLWGFCRRRNTTKEGRRRTTKEGFDNKTLGGKVTFETFMEIFDIHFKSDSI